MTQKQRTPWEAIIGFTGVFCLIAWMLGVFEPPEAVTVPAPIVTVQAPIELTAEQKAEQAAKKVKDDAENIRFAQDVASVRQLKLSMKNPASFDLVDAIRMDDGTLCLTYRATNSFNAIMTGEAVITKDRILTSDSRSRFVAEHKKRCANKYGKGMRHIRWAL